jgi:predicted site-specific integrase-resolvase
VLEQSERKGEYEELVEDILTIIVSSRIYGKRGGRKRKEESNVGN